VTAVLELYVIRTLNVAIDDLSLARERSPSSSFTHDAACSFDFLEADFGDPRRAKRNGPRQAPASLTGKELSEIGETLRPLFLGAYQHLKRTGVGGSTECVISV